MSYILDALKKLEKNKIEHKVNLRELVVKDDSQTHVLKVLKRKNYLLAFLAFIFILFFFQNYSIFFNNSKTALNLLLGSGALKGKNIYQPAPAKIFGDLKPQLKNTENNLKPVNVLNEPKDTLPGLIEKGTGIKNERKTFPELPLAAKSDSASSDSSDLSDEELDKRLNHIEHLIQTKYLPEAVEKLTPKNGINEKPIDNLEKENPKVVLPQDISDLKLKGIVFFGKDNPLNFVLADYKGEQQVKLKAGDIIDDVEILEIHSEKILFLFRETIFERRI